MSLSKETEEQMKAYNFLRSQLGDLQKQKADIERKIGFLETGIILLGKGLCKPCYGHGKVWVHYAQDDAKLEPCAACKGTGKEPSGSGGVLMS